MADINCARVLPAFSEAQLREAIELLFFAYRDFTGEPDDLLAKHGFGRAHHRVIYFVGRHPGITVSDLLTLLRITKQSLSRVLGQLVREGYIRQTQGESDRRQRLLALTPRGLDMERRLTGIQLARIARAYDLAGPAAVEGFRSVMCAVTDDPHLGREAV
jgi:DNA-binding MarR family transcriptional regulator